MEPTPDTPSPDPDDTAPWWYVTWVEPYVADPALWPVVFALAGHVVVLIVPVLLAVIRTLHPVAFVLLAMEIGLCVEVVRFEVHHRGRPKGVSIVLGLTWLVSFGVTWLALETGFL